MAKGNVSQLKAKAKLGKNPNRKAVLQGHATHYTHTHTHAHTHIYKDVYAQSYMNDGVYLRVMKTFPNFRY